MMRDVPSCAQQEARRGPVGDAMTRRRPRVDVPTVQRKVHLTDAEWREIGEAADARGVSRSRYIAAAALGAPVATGPSVLELIDEMRLALDGVARVLAPVAEHAAPLDAIRICTAIERIEGRLIAAVDLASASPGGRG